MYCYIIISKLLIVKSSYNENSYFLNTQLDIKYSHKGFCVKLATNPTPKLKVMVVKALNDATGLLYLI